MRRTKRHIRCVKHSLTSALTVGMLWSAPAAAQGRTEPPAPPDDQVVGIDMAIDAPGRAEVMTVDGQALSRPPDLPLEEPLHPDSYVCGSGDELELRFWGRQNLTIRISVGLEGSTFIPKVGKIWVAGKTLAASRKAILAAVRRYYPGLRTDVALVRPRDFIVHVVGEVKKPGVYRSNPRERLSSLIGRVGGATGSIRRIEVRHRDDSSVTADLLLYERKGQKRHNPYLLDGDVVMVPKPGIEVSIRGPVRHPGRYELVATRDLAELIELAGGLEPAAARTLPIEITRRNRDERRVVRRVDFERKGAPPNAPLADDDEVQIASNVELERSVVLVGAVIGADPADPATTIKRLSYVEGDTVRSLVERAGGVTVSADLANSYIQRKSKTIEPIDLETLLIRRDFRADRRIAVGDSVIIPFRRRSVMVEGSVMRPGTFQFDPRMGLPEYVASAGGATRYAQGQDGFRIVGADGTTRRATRNRKIQPGDTIVVPERNFSRAEIVQLTMSAAGIVLSAVALGYSLSR